MLSKLLVILILIIFCPKPGFSQVPETILTDKIEEIAQSMKDVKDYTELIEGLLGYAEKPLNLNMAEASELENLFFLNNMQIFNLLAYRETYGPFLSVYELQAIEGFDEEVINMMLPFITVEQIKSGTSLNPGKILKYSRHEIFLRYNRILQEKKGYTTPQDSAQAFLYPGNPDRYYFRYKMRYSDKFQAGITMEKDPGEVLFINNVGDSTLNLSKAEKLGLDFFSAHFQLKNIGILKSLVIGDYQVRFGQGLTVWSGLAFGKSSTSSEIKRFANGISPYTSTNENRFFRGTAGTIKLKNFSITSFYSKNKVDARLSRYYVDKEGNIISSLNETGLHRTISEIAGKDIVEIMAGGGNINFRKSRFSSGLSVIYYELDARIKKDPLLYNLYRFEGNSNLSTGLDFNYVFNYGYLFGEATIDKNKHYAFITGFTTTPHPAFRVTLSYRDYQKNFHNIYANAFGNNSENINERGFYCGIDLKPANSLSITGYYDLYNFQWLKYRVDGPSTGNDKSIQIAWHKGRKLNVILRFIQKNKQINIAEEGKRISSLTNQRQNKFRVHAEYPVSNSLTFRNRVEILSNKNDQDYQGTGFLIYHDIIWRKESFPLDVIFRYAMFDTDTYDERIYAYENDVLYAFSIPAYYYKGFRYYAMIKYKLSKAVHFWIRFAQTEFIDRNISGSGLEEIEGNQRTEIKVQLRIKL
ncbi:MAG: helix-hairpin-helix domain-containing protein [Bacteroidales bacterium]|nr:helix-hairpin-helix domain-containing protein [Bacteroidales bacterium]